MKDNKSPLNFSTNELCMVLSSPPSLDVSTATTFQQELLEAIATAEQPGIWVDMSATQVLDSAGLMALVAGLTKAQSLDRELYLVAVSSPARIVFEVTQLDRIFAFVDDMPEAIAA